MILTRASRKRNFVTLMDAVRLGYIDEVKEFIRNGVNDRDIEEAFDLTLKYGNLEIIKVLLVRMTDNFYTIYYHALRLSAQYGHLEVVRWLLDRGANIRAINDQALQKSAGNGTYPSPYFYLIVERIFTLTMIRRFETVQKMATSR